jgi:hypothetical protein
MLAVRAALAALDALDERTIPPACAPEARPLVAAFPARFTGFVVFFPPAVFAPAAFAGAAPWACVPELPEV